jgi:hypothetical protein
MFRPLQDHLHGVIYEGTEAQQILRCVCVYGVTTGFFRLKLLLTHKM